MNVRRKNEILRMDSGDQRAEKMRYPADLIRTRGDAQLQVSRRVMRNFTKVERDSV